MINIYGLSLSFINILSWLAFGLVTGLIAATFSTDRLKGGLLAAILLGVIGAVTGGAIATFMLGIGMRGFDIIAFATAIAGAIIFLVMHRLLLQEKRHIKSRVSL